MSAAHAGRQTVEPDSCVYLGDKVIKVTRHGDGNLLSAPTTGASMDTLTATTLLKGFPLVSPTDSLAMLSRRESA